MALLTEAAIAVAVLAIGSFMAFNSVHVIEEGESTDSITSLGCFFNSNATKTANCHSQCEIIWPH